MVLVRDRVAAVDFSCLNLSAGKPMMSEMNPRFP